MAITTIPWGDGSGDNIYLSAPSQTGDQSVSVTSDPNTGAARSKVVTFSASGVSPVTLTINQDAGSRLPAGYTELEYVTTNSNAYIDTGVSGGTDQLRINLIFEVTKYVQYGALYGNWNTDNHRAWRIILSNSNQTTLFANAYEKAVTSALVNYNMNTKTTLETWYGNYNCNGTTGTIPTTSGTANSRNVCLGNRCVENPVSRDIGLKIYYFKITQDGTPVIEYIPCISPNNEVGFYNLVNNTFKKSDTETDFVAGNPV